MLSNLCAPARGALSSSFALALLLAMSGMVVEQAAAQGIRYPGAGTPVQYQQPIPPTNQGPPAQTLPTQGVAPQQQPAQPPAADAQNIQQLRPLPFFNLTQQEDVLLNQVLELWETESGKVKSFKCPIERWVYDPVFGQGADVATTKEIGQLKYAKPDKGMFKIDEVRRYTPPAAPGAEPTWETREGEYGEHWVCDGSAVYQYDTKAKQLLVNELPPQMRGQAIADGPLPFLFGAEKDKLKARYSMKVEQTQPDIWITAIPRWREDAADYRMVRLILNRERFLPSAIQVERPNGKTREVFIFHIDQAKVNDPLERFVGVFQQPRTPFGWEKIIQTAPAQPQPSLSPQAGRPGAQPRQR